MPDYRIYAIAEGHVARPAQVLSVESDDKALTRAVLLPGMQGGFEVWCGARLVRRVAGSANLISPLGGRTLDS